MSFWAKVGVAINDTELFKEACKKHQIDYEENHNSGFLHNGMPVIATLRDRAQGSNGFYRSHGYLVKEGNENKIVIDGDAHYSSIVSRLGSNAGKLIRDYTKSVVERGVLRSGGMINLVEEKSDGSILMKVSAI